MADCYAECHNAKCCKIGLYAECHYPECRYAECHGAGWTRPKCDNWNQGILKGEVSQYHWPPVWLVWNQLYDCWQFLFFYFQNRLIQTSQTGGQQYSDTSPFSIPWLKLTGINVSLSLSLSLSHRHTFSITFVFVKHTHTHKHTHMYRTN
jgi:hypothetical protein